MKTERDTGKVFTDGIRELAHRIVDTSTEILAIDHEVLEQDLLKRLQVYQNELKNGPDPFTDEVLSPENELGLNLFLNVANFCFQDPQTSKSYSYTNKEGKVLPRFTGLKAAMVESGVNWGNTMEVSNLSSKKWAEIIQLKRNKEFYLGAERGRRIAEFALTFDYSGFRNITEFLAF